MMTLPCGCCRGVEPLTPQSVMNRPGLPALTYRVGRRHTFLDTMLARLSSSRFPELSELRSREPGDPTIALLDGCATMLDVLTFYQERLANEGYLRTAMERRSVLELARLIGYRLRPGVSASVFLAFDIDANQKDRVVIPAGSRVQSVPAPGETAQTFETSEPLTAAAEWNRIAPRMTRPQVVQLNEALKIDKLYFKGAVLDLKANDPLLLVFGDSYHERVLRRVHKANYKQSFDITEVSLLPTMRGAQDVMNIVRDAMVQLERIREDNATELERLSKDPVINRTINGLFSSLRQYGEVVLLSSEIGGDGDLGKDILSDLDRAQKTFNLDFERANDNLKEILNALLNKLRSKLGNVKVGRPEEDPVEPPLRSWDSIVSSLVKPKARQPGTAKALFRTTAGIFSTGTFESRSETVSQLMRRFRPALEDTLSDSLANAHVTDSRLPLKAVFKFRLAVVPFAANAPARTKLVPIDHQWVQIPNDEDWPLDNEEVALGTNGIFLDQSYDIIAQQSYVVIERSGSVLGSRNFITSARVISAAVRPYKAYGMSGKTTVLKLSDPWRSEGKEEKDKEKGIAPHRSTWVVAASQPLDLSEMPLHEDITGKVIELTGVYDGLLPGRWIIVSGERSDVTGTSGVTGSELMMIDGSTQEVNRSLPGDKIHTVLSLAGEGLSYTYKRQTVGIFGNVVKATHGETRAEVLGSGNPAQSFQLFTLKQPPLTYVSAPTRDGIESTLTVRVNDVAWPEATGLPSVDPHRRIFLAKTDDDAKTTVIFGVGARPSSGIQNLRASYRNGLGQVGNVKANQLTLLATRPLGVKGVTNPIRASGGADKETRDQAKQTCPLSVLAGDRLVSTQDYADFARTFAGIGKAQARRITNGTRQLVHITVAGIDDSPLDDQSDVLRNLRKALLGLGDPSLPIEVEVRELLALIISADVAIEPDYEWEKVEPRIRTALLDAFGFERTNLGQSVPASRIVSVMQQIAGVRYVDLNVFDSLSEADILDEARLQAKLSGLKERRSSAPRGQFDGVVSAVARFDSAKSDADARTVPAQLAILVGSVPDTLILNVIGAPQ